jgi:hypothetical protein
MQWPWILNPECPLLHIEPVLAWEIACLQYFVILRLQLRVSQELSAGQYFEAAIFLIGIHQRELDAEVREDFQTDI